MSPFSFPSTGLPFLSAVLLLCVSNGVGASDVQAQTQELQTEEVYRQDGTLLERYTYYIDESGQKVRHGVYMLFSGRGFPIERSEFENGKRHGLYMRWCVLVPEFKEEEGRYVNGSREGVWVWWLNKRKEAQCTYRNGKIVGKKVFFIRSGKVPENTVRGEEVYDEDGYLTDVIDYWDFTKGVKRRHARFRRPDRANPEDIERMMRGEPPREGFDLFALNRPVRHGVTTYWDKNGKIVAEGTWKDGKPWEGVCATPLRGSLGGVLETFARYRDGKKIEDVPHPYFNKPDKEHGKRGHSTYPEKTRMSPFSFLWTNTETIA